MLPLTTLRKYRQRWGGMVLGFVLIILPVRGWAESVMHLPPDTPELAASAASGLPCHAEMIDRDHDPVAPDESGSDCSMCSLCHGSALCQGEYGAIQDKAVTAVPAAAAQGHGPPALPLPERPPRG